MSVIFEILCVSLTLLLTYIYILRPCQRPKKFPPGPRNLPIIGGLHHVKGNFLEFVKRMHKTHGDTFSFNLGSQPCVVLGDFDLFKQLASSDNFNWRPHDLSPIIRDARFPDSNGDLTGIFFSNGKEWQEQRRFALKNLRDFGFGKLSMEELVQEEVEKAKTLLEKELDKPTSLNTKLCFPSFNALWHLMSGERLSYDDEKFQSLFEKNRLALRSGETVGLLDFFPWLKNIAPKMSGYLDVYRPLQDMQDFIRTVIHQHQETYQDEHMRDLMDAYIKKIRSSDNQGDSSFSGKRGEDNMAVGMTDLFSAGTNPVAHIINWALYYLAKNTSKKNRLFQEVDAVIGKNRLPSMEDKPKMPYMEAVTTEVHRLAALGFIGVPREVKKGVDIGPYHFPGGTRIFPSFYWIMHDAKYWSNPESFIPERFIDEDSGAFKPDERWIPFSMGKRNCLGKNFAQVEFFLFLAGFLQRFDFVLPPETEAAELKPNVGFILDCPDYDIIVKEREC